jgi:hypothetical protein
MVERHAISEPADLMLAQYSIPFCVALALFREARDPESYDESALNDPQIRALTRRVKLVPESGGGHGAMGSTVTVTLADGRHFERHVDSGLLEPGELPDKFTRLTRGALGEPGAGIAGFARTHRQAAVAQSVALAAGPAAAPVTPYVAVAGISFLCQDMDRARDWVRETLGELAVDDEAHARLRDSVSAFLDTGGSLSAAAERLGCHKNTVQYRIRRAEQALGHSVRTRRVDLELALQAGHWLDGAVLSPPPAP